MATPSFKHRGTAHLLALEPRMMFDAAAAATVENTLGDLDRSDHGAAFAGPHDATPGPRAVDTVMDYRDTRTADRTDAPSAADRSATPPTGAAHDVIFIDTAVDDYRTLAAQWAGKGDVILIDSSRDGIDQMRSALAGESDVAAIHIVSHGAEGVLYLGTTRIDEATIQGDLAGSLGAIGRSLNPGGDILLYGCDFAEGADGARALAAFAQATHADVAASTNLTGYAGRGGDWVLEAHDGAIQAHSLSSDDWQHTLDPNVPVPIAVTADSLTVTDGNGNVIVSGANGYTTTNGTDRSGDVGAGATARWTGAATLSDGTKVDLIAKVVSISNGDSVRFNRPTSATNGDDPTFLLRDASNGNATNGDGANVQILWSLVRSGTTTPIAANVEFGILDIDGVGGNPNTRESVSVPTDNLTYYTAERTTDIAITPSLSSVAASGTQNENTDSTKPLDTKSEVTFDWTKVSSFTINYSLAANNGVTTQAQFYQDGNADFKYSDPVSVSIPRLDLDGNDSTATGNDAHFTFTTGGPDSAIVDSDVVVSNPMDINSVTGATLTLTNAKAGDALHVGTLPSGLTATVTNGNGTITVALSGTASQTTYDTALRAVTFANSQASPDTTQRVIDVSFSNAKLTSATAVSRIDINRAPVANPDSATTPEDTAKTIAVLTNDTDADGDPLVVTSASAPHGSVTINGDGTLNYTPNADYNGSDTITYSISDNRGGTATSTVAVTVTPVNDPPRDVGTLPARNSQDAATVSYATAGGFADPDGDTLAYSGTGLPQGLSIDRSTGVISGTIDRSASQVNGGAYTVSVTATDPSNTSARQSFTLTVTNPPPVAQDDSATTPEEVAVTIPVLANDHDPDGDPLTVTSASAQHGNVAINPDGTLTYTPNALYRGSDSIAYTISDGQGGTSSAHVAVTVTPVNHAPRDVGTLPTRSSQDAATVSYATAGGFTDPDGDTLAYSATGLPQGLSIDPSTGVISGTIDRSTSQVNGGAYTVSVTATDASNASATQTFALTVTNPPPVAQDDSATAHVNTPITIAVLANDRDPDGDPLTVTAATPHYGSVAINGDGTLAYTPLSGFAGTDTIAYTISDGQGGTSSATVTVTVANAAPTHSAIAPQAVNDAQTVSLGVAPRFADADGDTLTYSATGLPPGLTIDPATGVVSGTIDRSASQANGGVYNSVVTANDGHGGTDSAPIRWTVTNPPPIAQDDSATTPEDVAVTIPVLANDRDPDGDPLTVTSASAQHGGVAINPDGTLTYTPNALYRGMDSIAYAISDGQGGTSTAHVAVTVTPVDHAPTAQPIAPQAGVDAQAVALDVGGFFRDADGDPLTYSATGLPPGLTIDPVTGRIAGTLDHSASRGSIYHVVVTATDPSQAQASSAFDWTITNPAPVAADDAATVAEEARVTIPVLANDRDPDGDPLTVTAATAQHGQVTINPDGTIDYRPDALFRGNDVIAYTIADGDGGTASASVLVTVTPVDHAPTAVMATPPEMPVTEGAPVAVTAAPWFRDVDGDTLTYSATGLPKGLSIDPASGAISGTVDHAATGQAPAADGRYTVVVTATDPDGLSASATFVAQTANPPPVATDSIARTNEDTGAILPALANVRDPDGDPLTVTAATAQHGTVSINPDGTLAYVPGPSFVGTDTVRYTVTDSDGATATAIVTVSVEHVNHPPVVPAQDTPVDARGGVPVRIDALAGVTDADGDRPTIVQATSANGDVTVSPDGVIRFTPDLGFTGTTTITYVVADGQGGLTSATLIVRVADGRGADIEELLRIGRVAFVDPSPGFARVIVPDGVIRNPLTILDTVEGIRSLGATTIGRQPVGDAVEAIRTLDGTAIDRDHPVLKEVARLDRLRDQRDAGDWLFDHRWGDILVHGASGFSAAADGHACIMVESVVRGGAIYLEVRDTAPDGAAAIRSVDVRPAQGPAPDWIRVDHRGLAIIERGADMDELHLIVRVTREDGHVSTTPIVVQGATGEVELDRPTPLTHANASRAAPLDATLVTRHAAARHHAARIDRIFQ